MTGALATSWPWAAGRWFRVADVIDVLQARRATESIRQEALPSVADLEYVNAGDVARLLRVAEHTIWKWRQQGCFPPAYRFGAAVRWRREEIEEWARSRREVLHSTPVVVLKSPRRPFRGRRSV